MPRLSCGVSNCGNNNENYCCISNINVSGESATNSVATSCSSFTEQTGATNCEMTPNPEVGVSCKADNCKHNSNSECKADVIEIQGQGASSCQETQCSSFSNKL